MSWPFSTLGPSRHPGSRALLMFLAMTGNIAQKRDISAQGAPDRRDEGRVPSECAAITALEVQGGSRPAPMTDTERHEAP